MEIYLLRHGTAERQVPGQDDSDRALTEEGRYEVRRVIAAAKLAQVSPSVILASPYLRAQQTAEIAADVLDVKDPIVSSEALAPHAGPRAVWEEIRVHRSEPSVLLAGHEPLFSGCTAFLLGYPDVQVDFPKAGLVRIDLDSTVPQPRGILKWMLSPDLIPL